MVAVSMSGIVCHWATSRIPLVPTSFGVHRGTSRLGRESWTELEGAFDGA